MRPRGTDNNGQTRTGSAQKAHTLAVVFMLLYYFLGKYTNTVIENARNAT